MSSFIDSTKNQSVKNEKEGCRVCMFVWMGGWVSGCDLIGKSILSEESYNQLHPQVSFDVLMVLWSHKFESIVFFATDSVKSSSRSFIHSFFSSLVHRSVHSFIHSIYCIQCALSPTYPIQFSINRDSIFNSIFNYKIKSKHDKLSLVS